ncbi:MAG: GAF domain-containing protein [Anaerolineae bacterium]|nr:GAF domain-containing protein [Anaerolineae bacterium]
MNIANGSQPDNKPTVGQILKRLLIEPAATITELGERQQALILAALSLVLTISITISILIIPVADRGNMTVSARIGLAVLFALSYIISRTRYFKVGAWFIVLTLLISAYLLVFFAPVNLSFVLIAFSALAFVIAVLLLSTQEFGLIFIGATIVTFMLPIFMPDLPRAQFSSAGGIIMTLGALLYISGISQRNLEQRRLSELQQSNKMLENLSASLEDRVTERTSQLAEATQIAQLANWEYDVLNDLFTFNDAFYALLRTTVEQEGGYTMSSAHYTNRFVHPDDAALVGQEIGKAIAAADPTYRGQIDHRIIYADGEIGTITVRFRIEKDEQGRTIRTIGANQDISERKRIEDEVRKFQLALERSNDIVFMTDIEGRITYVNPIFEETYGYTREEAVGQTPRILKSGLVSSEEYTHIWQNLLNKQAVAVEITNKTKEGQLIEIEGVNTAILDQNNNLIGFMATQRDVTSRKAAEEEIRVSRERYAIAVEGSNDGIWDWDIRTNVVYFSPRWKQMVGYEEHEVENSFAAFEALIHDEDRPRVLSMVGDYLENRLPEYDVEFRFRHKNGSYRWIRARGKALRDEQGRPYRMAGSHSDITLQKENAVILAQRAAQLETVTQVANSIATIQDPQILLQTVTDLTKERFNLYHAHIYLLDEAGDTLVLSAGAGEVGQAMVTKHHAIPLHREQSLVARAARSRQGVIVNDVTQSPDFLPNPLLPDTKAELAAPIIANNRVLGVLDVQANQADYFTEEDARIQTILAVQIGVALENARANEANVRNLRELDLLTNRLTREGWQSYMDKGEQDRLGYLFAENQLVPLHATEKDVPQTVFANGESAFVQPVMVRGEQIGQLAAANTEMEPEEFEAILAAVSQGLSTHLDNLRLNEQSERALAETRQRTIELNTLNELGRALTMANDVDTIVQHVCTYLPQLIPANDFYIALNHPSRQEVEIRVFIGGKPYSHFTREQGNGITEYVLRTRQPIFIQGNLTEVAEEKGFQVIGRVTQAFMGVPMIVGQDTLGVIAAQNETDPYHFTASHYELLNAVASQMAIAISNVLLLIQTQARADEMALINRVVSSVASSLDIRQSMQIVANELAAAANVEQIGIALFNEQRTSLTLVAEAYDPEKSVSALGFVIPVEGNLSTQEVMRTRKPLIITDPLNSPLTAAFHDGLRMRGVQTLNIFPMIVGNEMIGTVGIDILEPGRVLTPDQMRLVETIIYQASIAVDNARLFEQTEQALKEVRTLYDVSIQLNAARTLPEAMQALAQPAIDNGASAAGMFTFELDEDGTPQWGVVAAAWQRQEPIPVPVGTRFYLPEFPASKIWLDNPNNAIFFENIFTDERADEGTKGLYQQLNVHAAIWIPLVSQTQWLGLIYISWPEPRPFSAGEIRLYESLRTQGTTIVENRLLYEQSQARAAELGVINQVAETVARQLDPNQVMESVYQQIQRVLITDAFLIGLYDAVTDEIHYPILYDNGVRYEQSPVTRDSQSYIYKLIDTGKPIMINLTAEEIAKIEAAAAPTVGHIGAYPASLIYVPLFSGTKVIGAMSVQSYQPNAYDDGDLTLLIGIASHVAVALENSRLFAQTQERAVELATLNEMSRIASSQLRLSSLIQAVGEQIGKTFQASGVYVALFEAEQRRIVFPYFMETDDGEQKLVDIPPRSLDEPGITSRIIQTRQPILVTEDTSTQMHALGATTTSSGGDDVQAYLGVPMIVGDEVIGVIAIQNDVGLRLFTLSDQKLLSSLASTIGIAIQNAQQFERTQRRAQRERLLNEITQKIQGTHTMQGALETAVNELGLALKAKYARVEIAAESPANGKNGA